MYNKNQEKKELTAKEKLKEFKAIILSLLLIIGMVICYLTIKEVFVYATGGYEKTIGVIENVYSTTSTSHITYTYKANNWKYKGTNGPVGVGVGDTITVYYSRFLPGIAYGVDDY